MATVEIDQKWIDELEHVGNGKAVDISAEIEAAIRHHLFKLRQAKISKEREYYEANHTELSDQYLGQYIAIHDQKVVDSGKDGHALSEKIRAKLGRIPTAIILVEKTPEPPAIVLRAPRLGTKIG